jgi:serine/threonine protein phosphatase PrpC
LRARRLSDVPLERPVWAATHMGRVRIVNEDRCLVGDWRSNGRNAGWRGSVPVELGWAVIADGMGGHHAGDVASEVALAAIAKRIRDVRTDSEIEKMLDAVNEEVFEAMYTAGGRVGMGTTIVGAMLIAASAQVFNIGDSRAYSMRRDRLIQQSCDDTVHSSAKRLWPRSHALTQSLGGTLSRLPLQPHITRLALTEEDQLLLCSDGLTDMLKDEEIVRLLVRNRDNPAERLVAAALDAGGTDNVTAVVIGTARNVREDIEG